MPEQLKTVILKCANCGGALEIYGDMERFACGYCGTEQTVERRGGTIGLRIVADAVARVQVGTDKTAAELALVRLDKERAITLARWQEAQAEFARRTPYSSNWATLGLACSACVLPVALAVLVEGSFHVGSMVFSIILGGGAIGGFILALRANANTRKRYSAGRSELWRPYAKHIEELEMQIEKERRVVNARQEAV